MEPISYCYWLQGYVELCGERPTPEQWASIKEHLALVFTKVTKPGPGEVVGVDEMGRLYPPHELPKYCIPAGDGEKIPVDGKLCDSNAIKLLDLIVEGPICGEVNCPVHHLPPGIIMSTHTC